MTTTPDTIPVGGFAAVTDVISAAAQVTVLAELAKLTALIPNTGQDFSYDDQTAGVNGVAPFYDKMHPGVSAALRVEIAALVVAIDAAPTA